MSAHSLSFEIRAMGVIESDTSRVLPRRLLCFLTSYNPLSGYVSEVTASGTSIVKAYIHTPVRASPILLRSTL